MNKKPTNQANFKIAMKPWEKGYILLLNTCDVIHEPYCGPTQVLSTGKLLNSTSYEQQRGVTSNSSKLRKIN